MKHLGVSSFRNLGCLERTTNRTELPFEARVERRLNLIVRGVIGLLERFLRLDAARKGPDERPQLLLAVGLNEVIDQDGRFVVRERDQLRVGEAVIEVCDLERLAGIERLRELDLHATTPVTSGARFLPLRDALG